MNPGVQRPILALIANSHEWWARSLGSVLSPLGVSAITVHTAEQLLDRVRTDQPDLVIIDTELGDRGTELCAVLRRQLLVGNATPIVLTVPGVPTRAARLAGFGVGAWEVVGLPLDGEEFVAKMRCFLAARAEAHDASEDGLIDIPTGMYNMRGLLRRLREVGADALRYRRPLACLVLSVDGLVRKADDASENHRILADVAEAVHRFARVSDAVGRIGELELVLLAPATDAEGAMRLAERLAMLGDDAAPPRAAGDEPRFARVGCYAVDNFHEAAIEPVEMLVRATLALRSSAGSALDDRIQFFSAEPSWR